MGIKNLSANQSSESIPQRSARSSPYIIDLNTTTSYPHQNVTIFGEDSDDKAGHSVASGDINGDTRDDIIIGAYQADGPANSRVDCGEVYVIYSGSSITETMNLTSQADIVIYGADNGDQLGFSVSSGDVNGDSISDIIIGATQACGPGNGRGNCGEVYVFFGSGSLQSSIDLSFTTADVNLYGPESNDHTGISLGVGDVNDDNIDDIIIGSRGDGPGNSRIGCGEVYVIYGNKSLSSTIDLAIQADLIIYGTDAADKAGCSVASGDVNNDGYDDIIIGAYEANGPGNVRTFCGEVCLIYGNNTLSSPIDLASQADMTVFGVDQIGLGSRLGLSVTSGEVNGDSYDDIIMGAYMERVNFYIGAVHVIYGNSLLPLTQDLEFSPSNVTILGSSMSDSAGWSVIAGDINGDYLDDIVIGATQADGPADGRSECGEVYVINGSSCIPSNIDLSITSANITIYGADAGDGGSGSNLDEIAFSVGKIDNDYKSDLIIGLQLADGFKNSKLNCGEVYLILSSGDMSPKLKSEFIGLINGDGINSNTCYAKYKPYTFKIKVTDTESLEDLDEVTLSLDYNSENLQYRWSESTGKFTELNDPKDYTALDTTSSYRNNGIKSWHLDFNITFNWSYPDNDFHNVQVYSTSDTGLYDWLNLSGEIYRVENHLNFNGSIIAIGNDQGPLAEGDLVRGGEQLTWEGLKVVYNGTEEVYPTYPNVTVTVWDSDNDSWSDSPTPGENISITTIANNETNLNEIYTINITGVPSNCDKSNVTFKLKIDADNVTFSNPFPGEKQWQATLDPQCGITISDPATKVNASSIQYRLSTDNGTTWENDWTHLDVQPEDAKSVDCLVKPNLKEGRDNLIKWRAKDIVGNGFNESEEYRILVDVSNVTFTDATPSSDEGQTNLSVVCNITIIDNLSGVNASSIEFRISTDGIFNYGTWQSAQQTINGNIIQCSVNPTFEGGEDNFIQWRAKDAAGNGPYVSEDYQIKINLSANHPPTTNLISPSNNKIINILTPELSWSGNDPDGDSPIYYNIYLSQDNNKIISKDSSVILESSLTTTKYIIKSPLLDGTTYFWTVIPFDGQVYGECQSGIWEFRIDTKIEIPKVTLLTPIDKSNVLSTTPTLAWTVDYSDIDNLTYNIYLDILSGPQEIKAENYTETSFIVEKPLIRGETYFWKVIPIAHLPECDLQGICLSNVWSFNVEETPFIQIFSLDLKLEDQNLTVRQGNKITTSITLINTGNGIDIFTLNLDKGKLNANITSERSNKLIKLNKSEEITLELGILVFEDTVPQDYTVYITAVSNGSLSKNQNVSVTKLFNLKVIRKESPQEEKDQLALWLIILIIIIILILVIFLLIYRKKKAAKTPEIKEDQLQKQPELVALPEVPSPSTGEGAILPSPKLVAPTPTVQVQPQETVEKVSVPSIAPSPQVATPAQPEQAEIESYIGEEITGGEKAEEGQQPTAMEEQRQQPPIAEPAVKPEPQEPTVEQPVQQQSESEVIPQVPQVVQPGRQHEQSIPRVEDSED